MSKVEQFNTWACGALRQLGLPDVPDIIRYLQPLNDPAEVREYLHSMLDMKKPKHIQFVVQFLEKQAESTSDNRYYRKGDQAPINAGGKKKKVNANQNNKGRTSDNAKGTGESVFSFAKITDKENSSNGKSGKQTNPEETAKTKKKAKQTVTSLEDIANDVVLRKGRYTCECLASRHRLVNNCLSCGRIVCEQEGVGECLTCGEMIYHKDKPMPSVPVKKSGKSDSATLKDITASAAKAVEHKNMLLEFDQTSEKRTQVFDDEKDYFDSNSRWISKDQREALQAREQELKDEKYDRTRSKKLTLDLLGRRIVEEEDDHLGVYNPDDPVLKALIEENTSVDIFSSCERSNDEPPREVKRPLYVDMDGKTQKESKNITPSSKAPPRPIPVERIQDPELQVMTDRGRCLSMHQPYASLLVAGLKIHEGRTWYSPHRGRLWIAAAQHQPTTEDIAAVEDSCRHRVGGGLVMPSHYPTGVLLGYCDVQDVLPQDEYRRQYPDGDSESPYVFVCANSAEMRFKFPMKGQHKIFSLDHNTHAIAKKTTVL